MLTSVNPPWRPASARLAEVQCRTFERQLVAKGNDCIDHAQRDTAVDELKQDFHNSVPDQQGVETVDKWRGHKKKHRVDGAVPGFSQKLLFSYFLTRTSELFLWSSPYVHHALFLTSPNTGMLAVMASWSLAVNGLLYVVTTPSTVPSGLQGRLDFGAVGRIGLLMAAASR
jgi:hypothetical protein